MMLVQAHEPYIIHYFVWGVLGECGLDEDWEFACNEAELMNFAFRLKSGEELNHFSLIEIRRTLSDYPKDKMHG
jgi:hypothetical protein